MSLLTELEHSPIYLLESSSTCNGYFNLYITIQQVSYDGQLSPIRPVQFGVPQGSVLGPYSSSCIHCRVEQGHSQSWSAAAPVRGRLSSIGHRHSQSHARRLLIFSLCAIPILSFPFLANVNSRSRSLYAIARPSVVCLSSVVCRL